MNIDHLDNVRRTLERGLKACQAHMEHYGADEIVENFHAIVGRHADTYQHALDELKRAGVKFPEDKP